MSTTPNPIVGKQIYIHIRPLKSEFAWIMHKARIYEPAEALGRLTPSVIRIENPTPRLRHGPDSIFMYQRVRLDPPDSESSISSLTRHGYVTVLEFDDHPIGFEDHVAQNFHTFGSFHAIQTTTEEIADFLRSNNINQEVGVFPNQIAQLPPPPQARPQQPVRLLYAALRRKESWEKIMPGLNRILHQLGDKARILVMQDKEFFEALETEYKYFQPLAKQDVYDRILAQADINIMPLIDTEFNRAKSDLKFIESASVGAVCLASPTVYAKTMRHMDTGVIFHTPEEFENNLLLLVNNYELRNQIRANAYRYVKEERLIDQHIHKRYEWYCSLIERRDELNAALLARRPTYKLS